MYNCFIILYSKSLIRIIRYQSATNNGINKICVHLDNNLKFNTFFAKNLIVLLCHKESQENIADKCNKIIVLTLNFDCRCHLSKEQKYCNRFLFTFLFLYRYITCQT